MGSADGDFLVLLACLLYLAVILGIGAASARFSSAGIGEFFLGGRRLSAVVVGLSAVVSGRSAWLLVGFTGMAFEMGLSALWAAAGYIVVELLLFLFVAPALRRRTAALGALTIPDFFEERFQDKSRLLRLLSALIILVFMTAYVSAQFVSGGKALGATFQMGQGTGLVVTAAIVLAYTMVGGFLAVSLTDLVQALFMILALVVLPVMAVIHLGGAGEMFRILGGMEGALLDPFALGLGGLIGFLGIGLGSPGNPHILVRYMSVKDPQKLKVSAAVGTLWNIVMAGGALFIGLAGRAVYLTKDALPKGDTENVYPELAGELLHPFVFGLVLAALLAAIMSTADSQLLVAASALVRDIYQKIFRREKDVSAQKLVLLSRIVIVLLVAAAVLFGFAARDLVFWLVLFAWSGLGASFGPTIILALFWKGATRAGIAAGLLSGTATVIAWKLTGLGQDLYQLIPGFAVSFLAVVLVSLAGRRQDSA